MPVDGLSHQAQIHGSLTRRYFCDGDWPLMLSTPERAVLELLDELPGREAFHQADVLMEGLPALSPKRTAAFSLKAEASR